MDRGLQYRVPRVDRLEKPLLDWESRPWNTVEPGWLAHFMGRPPEPGVHAAFRAVYDTACLHVFFRVHDRYVVARMTRYQDPVCQDSCVELFFYPGDSSDHGYFNLEVNCCGTFLFRFQQARDTGVAAVSPGEASRVGILTSLHGRIDPEIPGPLTWEVLVSLPFDLIDRCLSRDPGPPRVWRANVYACADRSSHPHWLTWNPIQAPEPDFHRPGSFGRFVFMEG